jgi:hypothetical protein
MENVMQPYEIRQFRDGTIDRNEYYARPVSLMTPNMRHFCRRAASPKTLLLVVATVAAIVLVASQSTHRMAWAQSPSPHISTSTNS